MSQHNIPDGLFHEVWQLYASGHTSDEILNRLIKREVDLEIAESVMSKVKTMRYAKRRSRGLIFSIIGAVLLVGAFLVTFSLHLMGYDADLVLYAMTTAGAGFLFTGMVFYMS